MYTYTHAFFKTGPSGPPGEAFQCSFMQSQSWEDQKYPIGAMRVGLIALGRHADHHEKLQLDSLTVMAETEKN